VLLFFWWYRLIYVSVNIHLKNKAHAIKIPSYKCVGDFTEKSNAYQKDSTFKCGVKSRFWESKV
jgi:hypothetical protein